MNPSDNLIEKILKASNSDWGMNTAFDKVFLDLLLPLAIKHNLKPEDMVKRLFVFSDMQFDKARGDSTNTWETSHEVIERKFKEAGYELPEIVYWNLSQQEDTTPVTHDQKGVALMSRFSPSMLKIFMGDEVDEEAEEEGSDAVEQKPAKVETPLDPVSVMIKAVSKESYSGLLVVE